MDGDGWSDGHLALFDALSTICKTIGKESAAEVAKHVAQSDGRHYITELNSLRMRAEKADQLQVENARLRSELDDALHQLRLLKTTASLNVRASNIQSGLQDAQSDESYKKRFEKLVESHNPLVLSHGLLKEAKDMLEITAKKRAKERDDWMTYADGLTRKIEKQEKKLKECDLLKSRSCAGQAVAPVPASLLVKKSIRTSARDNCSNGTNGNSSPSFNLPAVLSPSPSELEGETLIGAPEMYLMGRTKGEGCSMLGESIQEHPKSPFTSGNSRVVDELPRISPKTRNGYADGPILSPAHHSSSTQGDVDEILDLAAVITSPAPAIKLESALDSPVFLFTRSVRKSARSRPSPGNPAVKIENFTDSPSLAAVRIHPPNPHFHESMDLDDIGEKIDTPKKRRQVRVGVKTPIGVTFALHPVSPNKQILPQSSPRARPVKRKRTDDFSGGAELLAEDGENYEDGARETNMKTQPIQPTGKTQLVPKEVLTRLSGLLDNQSPQRQVLTHPKNQRQPVLTRSTGERVLQDGWSERKEKLARVNGQRITKQGPEGVSTFRLGLHATGAGQTRRTTCPNTSSLQNQEVVRIEADNAEHKPFRARPVRHLGLEHFKVNEDFSGGYNYAFQEVVRGREQRKCLPGCTKPECCGTIFRRIVESIMADEPTRSQEEKDELLLEEFAGTNKFRLSAMSEEERNEMLVEAKVRELANKSAKHRHAFERRRSPPGFWRSDFPSTQEIEADRAEARQMERKLVQERYDEAMRHGGRWKFGDE